MKAAKADQHEKRRRSDSTPGVFRFKIVGEELSVELWSSHYVYGLMSTAFGAKLDCTRGGTGGGDVTAHMWLIENGGARNVGPFVD